MAGPAWIRADPNPVGAIADRRGRTTLEWHAPGASAVEVRIGAPDGPLFSASGPAGNAATGLWVQDGTTFFLQDVTGKQALVAEHTLATVRVAVRRSRSWPSFAQLWNAAGFWGRVVRRKLRLRAVPIRAVFLAQDPLDWFSLHSVYEACAADPRFETIVVNAGFGDAEQRYATDCASLLKGRAVSFLDGHDGATSIAQLRPDLVLLSSPFDEFRHERYGIEALRQCARVVFISYCIEMADREGLMADAMWSTETHRRAWRIFARAPAAARQYTRIGRVPPRRIVALGHPRIDESYAPPRESPIPADVERRSAGKFRIIYAPHHFLGGWSTFLRHGRGIRAFVDAHDDCFLTFRPHPYLVGALRRAGIMDDDEFRAMFTGDRCWQYDGPDYWSLFRWSNALVSDASSFLVEYAPTRHPIVYLQREDGHGGLDDSIEAEVAGSCYTARTPDDMQSILLELKSGRDRMRDERARFQERMSVGMFSGGAGARVAGYLARTLA